jgi:hypothetical protein
MYGKKPMPGGAVYKGGTPNLNKATGQYSPKSGMAKPAVPTPPKPPMTKPQARMQAMQKRFQQ